MSEVKKQNIVVLIDVTDSNPNGDPDSGNMPRVDAETGHGKISSYSFKRKIRDSLHEIHGSELYIKQGDYIETTNKKHLSGLKPHEAIRKACDIFDDVRLFGGLVTKTDSGSGGGSLTGPVQFGTGTSVDPVMAESHAITRVCKQSEKDGNKKDKVDGDGHLHGTIGNFTSVAYGLYVMTGSIDPVRARKTGLQQEDVDKMLSVIPHMYELSASATRSGVHIAQYHVWTHDNSLGCEPPMVTRDRLQIKLRDGVEFPRSYSDYEVTLDLDDLPDGLNHHMYDGTVNPLRAAG